MQSLFNIIVPFLVIFLIISDLAFAILFILPSLPRCASPMLVMTPKLGFKILDKLSISPNLFIPTSYMLYFDALFWFIRVNGSPMSLLNDFCDLYVVSYFLNIEYRISLRLVFPELPVIPIKKCSFKTNLFILAKSLINFLVEVHRITLLFFL